MTTPTDPIRGVRVQELKVVRNERGGLMEVQRYDDDIFPGYAQSYITSTYPGIVKAWYRHRHQTDQITVITGNVALVLYDLRDDSPTKGCLNEFLLGDGAPKLVQFPPMIWHGYQTVSEKEAFVLHLNTIAYDHEHPDEDRIDPHDPSIPFTWADIASPNRST